MTPFLKLLNSAALVFALAAVATTYGCGDDDDSSDDDDDDATDTGTDNPGTSGCVAGEVCSTNATTGGAFACLLPSGLPNTATATACPATGCAFGQVTINGATGCFCVNSCTPPSDTGDDTSDDTGADATGCPLLINKICSCFGATSAQCTATQNAVNGVGQPALTEADCNDRASRFTCPNDTGDDAGDDTGATDDDDDATASCPTGLVCTTIPGANGGPSAEACLDANGQPPAGATQCNPADGSGCAAGQLPVGAQDAGGNTLCICLDPCGAASGDDDDDATGDDDDATASCPAGTSCGEIPGADGAPPTDVCLGPNSSPPAGAPSCDPTTGAGCSATQIPASAQDSQGNTLCICLEACGDSIDSECGALTCASVGDGGSYCVASYDAATGQVGIPNTAATCDATTGAGCAAGTTGLQFTDSNNQTICRCLKNCTP